MKKASFVKTLAAAGLSVALAATMTGCGQFSTYEPTLGDQVVPDSALVSAGTLKVGVDTGNSPMAGTSGGKIIGIDVDIAAALADKLGLALEVVDTGTDGEKALENEEVDIVMGVTSTTKTDYWLSSEYIQTGVVLFDDSGNDVEVPEATDEVKIAAQVSSKSAWAVTNTFGDDALESASDLASAFTDLKDGDVDFVASDAIIGLYSAKRQNIDVSICASLESLSGYCVMASADNSDLTDAVSDALLELEDEGIIDIIENKWLGQVLELDYLSKIEGQKASTTNVDGEEGEEGEDGENNEESTDSTSSSSSSSSSSSASSSTN